MAMLRRFQCVCLHPDPRRCLEWRHRHDEECAIDRDDRCECACHQRDEEGRDGWDEEGDGREEE